MENVQKYQVRISSICDFLKRGYGLRELIFKGFSLKIYSKLLSYLKYGFYWRGRGVEIDHRAVIDGSNYIVLHDGVWVQRGTWLVIPLIDIEKLEKRWYLSIGMGTRIGANCTISAGNKITIEENVLFGPNVMVLDHYHRYEDISRPISQQGICSEGTVFIEKNCWIGTNSVIYSPKGELRIGRNSVVAANSVVRASVPPFTIVSGNPAIRIKRFCHERMSWIKA